jgi:hypothetical protein
MARVCPECRTANHADLSFCAACGHLFTSRTSLIGWIKIGLVFLIALLATLYFMR